jgi:UDP-N-acetyl-D-glucosamine dehydrogenase
MLAGYGGAVIVTDHDDVDYALLMRFSKLVVDTRNALARRLGSEETRSVAKA